MKKRVLFILISIFTCSVFSQSSQNWNGKQCAVVLTYDDALNVHLDNVIPVLDSLNYNGTFYVMGAAENLDLRLDEWRKAAKNGHELGNHTLSHPCDGKGRSFVNPETDLSRFSMERAVKEIRITNTLLKAIDGKDKRSFAYPCGDLRIGDSLFYPRVAHEFAGARGVTPAMTTIDKVNLDNINCYMISNHDAGYMTDLVKQAIQSNTLLVFLFHGVGGEHNINVDLAEHNKLLYFMKENEQNIWVATMAEAADYIRKYQQNSIISGN